MAGGQDHEVKYEATKEGVSKESRAPETHGRRSRPRLVAVRRPSGVALSTDEAVPVGVLSFLIWDHGDAAVTKQS